MNLIESARLDKMTGKPITRKISGLQTIIGNTQSNRTYKLVAKSTTSTCATDLISGNDGELTFFLPLERANLSWDCALQVNGFDTVNNPDPNNASQTIQIQIPVSQEIKFGSYKTMNPLELFDSVDQDQYWSTAAALTWALDNDANHKWTDDEKKNVWNLLEVAVIEGKRRRISVQQTGLNDQIGNLQKQIAALENMKDSIN